MCNIAHVRQTLKKLLFFSSHLYYIYTDTYIGTIETHIIVSQKFTYH